MADRARVRHVVSWGKNARAGRLASNWMADGKEVSMNLQCDNGVLSLGPWAFVGQGAEGATVSSTRRAHPDPPSSEREALGLVRFGHRRVRGRLVFGDRRLPQRGEARLRARRACGGTPRLTSRSRRSRQYFTACPHRARCHCAVRGDRTRRRVARRSRHDPRAPPLTGSVAPRDGPSQVALCSCRPCWGRSSRRGRTHNGASTAPTRCARSPTA